MIYGGEWKGGGGCTRRVGEVRYIGGWVESQRFRAGDLRGDVGMHVVVQPQAHRSADAQRAALVCFIVDDAADESWGDLKVCCDGGEVLFQLCGELVGLKCWRWPAGRMARRC